MKKKYIERRKDGKEQIEKLNTGKSTTNTYCIILILLYVS